MKLRLQKTGGQGVTVRGTLDTAELPEDLATKVETVLTPERLTEAQRTAENTRMVDAQQYELTLLGDDEGAVVDAKLSDAQDIPDILDVLDELMGEIVRRRLEERRRADTNED